MKLRTLNRLMLPIGLMMLAACATANKELDSKVGKETAVPDRASLSAQSENLIQSAKGLSEDQRQQLQSLRESTRGQLDEISKESLKLRSVLIGDVMSPAYNAAEVGVIKRRLTKLENKKLAVIFGAVDRANAIFGRNAIDEKQRIMEDLIEQGQRPQF